jgi:deazaflavin-dependent oxidoreductase (nitroreductase family)
VSIPYLVLIVLAAVALAFVLIAVFERVVPLPVLRSFQKHVVNPLFRWAAGVMPGYAVIETIGRRSGRARRVPVGGGLRGDAFWLVAADGRAAQYVRNIEANPRVRVRVHGRWRAGNARVLPDDDPRRRMWRLNPANGLFIRVSGRSLLTVRIDLDAVAPVTDRPGGSPER